MLKCRRFQEALKRSAFLVFKKGRGGAHGDTGGGGGLIIVQFISNKLN